MPPRVSVLMPTFDQEAFVGRAVESLLAQTLADWELVVVNDGSPDRTEEALAPYRADPRVRYLRFERNRGLGAALNAALAEARGDRIAYLPSDDVYYADHLQSLADCLDANPDAILAYSGVRHHYNRSASGAIDGYPLQLVQVLHRRTPDRWTERAELVTDDLERMFWAKLRPRGKFVGTGRVTCEWVDHAGQRHKVIREPVGGVNPYRRRYGVTEPLLFRSSVGHRIDEVELYRGFRERPDTPPAPNGLKILLVGDLSCNPDHILALEELGHRLYGLWTDAPHWYTGVGPLPFGHVADLPRDDWRRAVRQLKPDVIYAQQNWQSVPFACEVLREVREVPFVWQFKEGPFICLDRGTWPQLAELYRRSDGLVYHAPEMRAWVEATVPGTAATPSLILDGDLAKREWFEGQESPKLSAAAGGEIHTVVPGRPIGLHAPVVEELARQRIHLHFYGEYLHGQWREWIERAERAAAGYLHLHPQVTPDRWVGELSRYDAGWLHVFTSKNGGEIRRANWDDLNLAARLGPLVAAGLPVIQLDNAGAIVASQALAERLGLGLFYRDIPDLRRQLEDAGRMARLREAVSEHRDEFTFDSHAPRLVEFFREVIARRKGQTPGARNGAALPGYGAGPGFAAPEVVSS